MKLVLISRFFYRYMMAMTNRLRYWENTVEKPDLGRYLLRLPAMWSI